MPAQDTLPRWRGFNLQEMFSSKRAGDWREDDFRWIADWGFDFVRLPMSYLLWVKDDDAFRIDESALAKVDRAVDLGARCGLHVSLNFHRAPGYSVNRDRREPFDLWKDAKALEAFCLHWETFAKRYKGLGTERLSFNLVNEPRAPSPEGSDQGMTRADHERVMRAAVAAVREIDPGRLILIDGLSCGNLPCPELSDLPNVAQSCRAYVPSGVSHYKAKWVRGENWPEPSWPGALCRAPGGAGRKRPGPDPGGETWDRARLERHYAPWVELAKSGVGVHCGEGGAFKFTPHEVVLAWLRDVLEILTANGIGLALWQFRGAFGVLDSGRADVDYDDFHGHRLDRKLLDLLREF